VLAEELIVKEPDLKTVVDFHFSPSGKTRYHITAPYDFTRPIGGIDEYLHSAHTPYSHTKHFNPESDRFRIARSGQKRESGLSFNCIKVEVIRSDPKDVLKEELLKTAEILSDLRAQLGPDVMTNRSIQIRVRKDWLRPKLYEVAKEWGDFVKELFPELISVKVVQNSNTKNGHMHVICEEYTSGSDETSGANGNGKKLVREFSIKIKEGEGNVDAARLIKLLNLSFAVGNIPEITDVGLEGIADYEKLFGIINRLYSSIIGEEKLLIPEEYTRDDINGLAVIVIEQLPEMGMIDLDEELQLDMAKEALQAV
jgi:hypothetical protein